MAERVSNFVENHLNYYSLNNPGIPFLSSGERFQITPLAEEKLSSKFGQVTAERFSHNPISNIVFHSENSNWVNGSWIVDIGGFNQEIFDRLEKPNSTTVRLLPVDDKLAQLSGYSQMVEIGYNVGGGELVFKRILLPQNFQADIGGEDNLACGTGEEMHEVFVNAWDKLSVATVDETWHNCVREQLLGNNRDINKQISYQMVNGEKWVEWDRAKMWAGLLSDRRDIDRFLSEENALASLKPGEFMVAKYSHGSGGVISAATSQKMKQQPRVVGDVQMMGENGSLYQAAVEGNIDQIDGLINGLVEQLQNQHNLSMPSSIEPPQVLPAFLESVPVMPIAMYPMKSLFIDQPGLSSGMPSGMGRENSWISNSNNELIFANPPLISDNYWESDRDDFVEELPELVKPQEVVEQGVDFPLMQEPALVNSNSSSLPRQFFDRVTSVEPSSFWWQVMANPSSLLNSKERGQEVIKNNVDNFGFEAMALAAATPLDTEVFTSRSDLEVATMAMEPIVTEIPALEILAENTSGSEPEVFKPITRMIPEVQPQPTKTVFVDKIVPTRTDPVGPSRIISEVRPANPPVSKARGLRAGTVLAGKTIEKKEMFKSHAAVGELSLKKTVVDKKEAKRSVSDIRPTRTDPVGKQVVFSATEPPIYNLPQWNFLPQVFNEKEIPVWHSGNDDFDAAAIIVLVTMFFIFTNTSWLQPVEVLDNSNHKFLNP